MVLLLERLCHSFTGVDQNGETNQFIVYAFLYQRHHSTHWMPFKFFLSDLNFKMEICVFLFCWNNMIFRNLLLKSKLWKKNFFLAPLAISNFFASFLNLIIYLIDLVSLLRLHAFSSKIICPTDIWWKFFIACFPVLLKQYDFKNFTRKLVILIFFVDLKSILYFFIFAFV